MNNLCIIPKWKIKTQSCCTICSSGNKSYRKKAKTKYIQLVTIYFKCNEVYI